MAATGLTFTLQGSRGEQYSLLVPEHAFHGGRNRVAVLLVRGDRLAPV